MKGFREKGVALVITLILLSLLMIMAVTFVALSRRERAVAATTVDQTMARQALESGLDHACARVLYQIRQMASQVTNGVLRSLVPEFFVSTNYINYRGFDPQLSVPNFTNVNYDYRIDGKPLSEDELVKVIANLFYDPRVPVAVRTNSDPRSPLDPRFYIDLNRNGRFEPNGYWPILDVLGNEVRDAFGIPITNYFVGDPEWIGVLERPGDPHSRTNRFIARFAYAVVPMDFALDVNFIHNQAKQWKAGLRDDDPAFFRNQGIGSWEINLAALLCDLNPSVWNPPSAPYYYETNPISGACLGLAFLDALEIYRGRFGSIIPSAEGFYGQYGIVDSLQIAFKNDYVDDYSDGPLLELHEKGRRPKIPTDDDNPSLPWSGSDSTNAYFSMQDLFSLPGFGGRLLDVGRRDLSTWNRYTFYRLTSLLGVDSNPETNKLNLNWQSIPMGQTVSFQDWPALVFFTNTAERLIQRISEEFDFVGVGMTNIQITISNKPLEVVEGKIYSAAELGIKLSVTNIPVWPVNFYTPGVHRLLQLAANIYEATTNRLFPGVYIPLIQKNGDGWIRVVGYQEFGEVPNILNQPPVEPYLVRAGDPEAIPVYNVPFIVGVRKGFPAFNEFTMMPVVVVTRKAEISRPDPVLPPATTNINIVYLIGISNLVALEAWNPYRTNYPRSLRLRARVEVEGLFTNHLGLRYVSQTNREVLFDIPANFWPGFNAYRYDSFIVPLYFDYDILPLSIITPNNALLPPNPLVFWPIQNGYSTQKWGLEIRARVWFHLYDTALGRVIDYVALSFPRAYVDISGVLTQGASTNETVTAAECWNPTRIGNSPITYGIKQQIAISAGSVGSDTDWRDYNADPVTGQDKQKAIQFFRAFLGPTNLTGQTKVQTPFNPVRKFCILYSWQANDPLVHYTVWDLQDVYTTNAAYFVKPHADVKNELRTIGYLNTRYEPWGGRSGATVSSTAFDLALKDPLVTCADDWAFPTNKLPTIGWLGRVHRGTPWQTVYLKATNIAGRPDGLKTWVRWSGNTIDPQLTLPVRDRLILDLFTTALNDNATRGQLSINQSALPAWSAVLSGILVMSNSTPDAELSRLGAAASLQFKPVVVQPEAVLGPGSPLSRIVNGINITRKNYPGGRFQRLGDILSTPELTEKSPYLNLSEVQERWGIPDAVYEWIPMQILSLLRCEDRRFVVFAYGQALRPADIVPSGPFMGLCTNYQVTAEAAAKATYRIEGVPPNVRIVQETFNWLGVDQ